MTDEQTKQNAEEYAKKIYPYTVGKAAAIRDFIAGAHSLDGEIECLAKNYKEEFDAQEEELDSLRKGFYERGEKLKELMLANNQLRNPWISVEERLPEEPFSAGSNRSKEVYVRTAKGCNYIGSYNFNRKDWIIVKDGYVELTNDNVIKWMPIPD